MDLLRWGVTPRTGGLLFRTDGIHGNFLRGSLNERDTDGGRNCQKLCNIHAAVGSVSIQLMPPQFRLRGRIRIG